LENLGESSEDDIADSDSEVKKIKKRKGAPNKDVKKGQENSESDEGNSDDLG
jgi:hypothetical protein